MQCRRPFINPKKKGAQDEKYILKPDAAFVKKNADMIKIITMAPEMDENFAAIREIVSDTDVVVSMGHTDATYEIAAAAVANGVRSTTHLFNAMSALGHRSPGVVGAALKYDVYTEMIVDTFHVDKSLYSIVSKQKGESSSLSPIACPPAGCRRVSTRSADRNSLPRVSNAACRTVPSPAAYSS